MAEEVNTGGWKTKGAAIAAMLTGAGMMLTCITAETFSFTCLIDGGLVFLGGAAIFGLRDAIGKLIGVLAQFKK